MIEKVEPETSRADRKAESLHEEASALIEARPDVLFAYLDDQTRLGAHMEQRSMMMMGGRMAYEFDDARGRAVGSVIKMGGRFLGLEIVAEEIVTERDPPRRKAWETIGEPRMLVIARYRMGFEILEDGAALRLRVFIDYDLPTSLIGRILGAVFANAYARWCVTRMAEDAKSYFRERRR